MSLPWTTDPQDLFFVCGIDVLEELNIGDANKAALCLLEASKAWYMLLCDTYCDTENHNFDFVLNVMRRLLDEAQLLYHRIRGVISNQRRLRSRPDFVHLRRHQQLILQNTHTSLLKYLSLVSSFEDDCQNRGITPFLQN